MTPNLGDSYQYRFGGMEQQTELGLEFYDFGARNYDPAIGRWMNVDPLAETTMQPYSYANNNPQRFKDATGMIGEDVIIKGNKAKEAFKQLKSSTSLKLKRHKTTGRVTATGVAKTEADRKLLDATTDTKITVEINATNDTSVQTSNGEKRLEGGAFMGSTVNEDDSITANQIVNPDQAEKIDRISGQDKGTTVLHETIESFIGAQVNPGSSDATNANSAYQPAHNETNNILERSGKLVNPLNAIITTSGNITKITNENGISEILIKNQ